MNYRIVEGYDRLVAHVGRGLDVELGFEVRTLRYGPEGVVTTSTDGRECSARAAICALPLGVVQSGRVTFAPALPDSKRAAMSRLHVGPVVKVLLRFEEPFWPRWLSCLGCGVGPATLYWPVFYDGGRPVPDKPAVLVAYATGPRAARLSAASEDEATATVLEDLARLFPRADPKARLVAHRRVDWTVDPLALGGYSCVLPGGNGARALLAAADTGALFWAGSATQASPIAETVEAAFLSGRRAAGELVRFLESGTPLHRVV